MTFQNPRYLIIIQIFSFDIDSSYTLFERKIVTVLKNKKLKVVYFYFYFYYELL